jgi:hypothetical protein
MCVSRRPIGIVCAVSHHDGRTPAHAADHARAAVLMALGLVGTLPTFFQIFE